MSLFFALPLAALAALLLIFLTLNALAAINYGLMFGTRPGEHNRKEAFGFLCWFLIFAIPSALGWSYFPAFLRWLF